MTLQEARKILDDAKPTVYLLIERRSQLIQESKYAVQNTNSVAKKNDSLHSNHCSAFSARDFIDVSEICSKSGMKPSRSESVLSDSSNVSRELKLTPEKLPCRRDSFKSDNSSATSTPRRFSSVRGSPLLKRLDLSQSIEKERSVKQDSEDKVCHARQHG